MTATLWPELPAAPALRGMKKMLEQAGSDLTEQTRGALLFRVHGTAFNRGELVFRCFVTPHLAPHIDIEVCRVETGLAAFPAKLHTADGIQIEGIQNEADLRTHLATVFQSHRTKEILVNLIANFG